jgi:hypothetical protein
MDEEKLRNYFINGCIYIGASAFATAILITLPVWLPIMCLCISAGWIVVKSPHLPTIDYTNE